MKYITSIIILMSICLILHGQKYRVQYTGSGSANIVGRSTHKYQISGGTVNSFLFSKVLPKSENINNNSQSMSSCITSNASQIDYNLYVDLYGNDVHEIKVNNISSPLEFECSYSGSIYTQINTACLDDQFPVNISNIPGHIQNYYLASTPNIQKDNSAIKLKALSQAVVPQCKEQLLKLQNGYATMLITIAMSIKTP